MSLFRFLIIEVWVNHGTSHIMITSVAQFCVPQPGLMENTQTSPHHHHFLPPIHHSIAVSTPVPTNLLYVTLSTPQLAETLEARPHEPTKTARKRAHPKDGQSTRYPEDRCIRLVP